MGKRKLIYSLDPVKDAEIRKAVNKAKRNAKDRKWHWKNRAKHNKQNKENYQEKLKKEGLWPRPPKIIESIEISIETSKKRDYD